MEWTLTEEHRKLRETCEKLGTEVLGPRAQELDETGTFPRENLGEMAKLGINSLLMPREYGGLAMDHVGYVLACETLAKYCASTTMVYVMHMGAAQTLNLAGNEDQKRRYLIPIREEGKIGTLAFSEPNTGGHFWYCTSQARRDGEDYIFDKDTSFCTSAGKADWYVVQTRTPDQPEVENMLYFLVNNDQEGVNAGGWRAMGMNGNSSGPIKFRNVKVKKENRLGAEGAARYWNDNAVDPIFLVGSSACWLGIAQGALDAAVAHATRTVHKDFGKKVSDYQLIRHYIARAQIHVDSVRMMLYRVAQDMDDLTAKGEPHESLLFAMWEAKVHAADVVIDVTNRALQVTGGFGYKRGKIEQYLRDGRAGALMGPSNEMCQEWIGRSLVGMPLAYWYEDRDVAPIKATGEVVPA